jgi:hypothetical protein
MTDDSELIPPEASEFSDEELEELIREVIGSMLWADSRSGHWIGWISGQPITRMSLA